MKMMKMPGYWRTHQYSTVLKNLLGLVSPQDKILSFQDRSSRQSCKHHSTKRPMEEVIRPTFKNQQKLDWSCHPRSKPIGFIEAVHDLPNIKTHYHKIIDWSAAGQIAAIFSKKLVIWTPNTDAIVGQRAYYATSLAFNPTGDQLVMAIFMLDRPWLNIMDFQGKPKGRLKMLEPLEYPVSYLIWDGSGQHVVCGFANGLISIIRIHPFSVLDREGQNKYCVHKGSITAIKFSCRYRYLATVDDLGQLYLWYWNGGHLTPITSWDANCVFFDWHPWREDEIVIADCEPMLIALYHVPSRQVLSYYQRKESDCILTTLSFNKISGELVVCCSFPDENKPPEILVLASMDRVVDVMRNHDDCVVHLLWSPDGKQLASVGYDETLTIWNFFRNSPTNGCKKRKLQREPTVISSNQRKKTIGGMEACRDEVDGDWNPSCVSCNRNNEVTFRDLTSSFLFKPMR